MKVIQHRLNERVRVFGNVKSMIVEACLPQDDFEMLRSRVSLSQRAEKTKKYSTQIIGLIQQSGLAVRKSSRTLQLTASFQLKCTDPIAYIAIISAACS